jgi:hypothetical protein
MEEKAGSYKLAVVGGGAGGGGDLNLPIVIKTRGHTHYRVEHRDKEGRLKGIDEFDNTITIAGLNKLIDANFKGGNASPAWYIGFVDGATTPTFDPSDTLDGHTGWAENTDYAEYMIGGRPAFAPGDVADGAADNTLSRAAFTITANGAIAGCFLTDAPTGDEGVLYGEGAYASGVRGVEIGDTSRVTATVSVTD